MCIDMNFYKKIKKNEFLCFSCMTSKMKKKIFRRFQNLMFDKNECLNSNFMNFIDSQVYDDFNYINMFICRVIEKI